MALRTNPDWLYLLREFDHVYRRGSAGGSAVIRSHRRRVREALSRIMDSDPDIRPREPHTLPVVAHLGRAIDLAATGPLAALARAVDRISGQITWELGYSRLPQHLARQYAYCELLGPQGPVRADSLIIGLVLFAPNTTYPQHSHHDIEESYVSVSGAWSENDVAVYAPGSLILNRSGHEHRITVGGLDPCLLAYAWLGPAERLAAPEMRFSKPARKG